jgi:hypothetical protein
LSESYSSLDSLLSNSRSLANSLIRSQKSDTWYLETAFYILVGTISWLIFRRVLYGPMWWLVWLPVKFAMRSVFALLGAVGILKGSNELASSSIASDISATIQQAATAVTSGPVPVGDASWDNEKHTETEQDRIIDKIGRMVESGKWDGTNIDDISPEERERQDEIPRNPKKRMYEEEEVVRDEL